MRRDADDKWLKYAMLALCLLVLAACKPRASGEPVEAPGGTAGVPVDEDRAKYEFVAMIDGVWRTQQEHVAEEDETIFRLGHMVDTAMFVNRNGVGMDVLTDHVNLANQSITFGFRESPTKEKMTLRLLPEVEGLRVTYADGRTETLTFLRDWNDMDTALVQAAEAKPMLSTAIGQLKAAPIAGWASTVDCNAASEFRARTVCKNEDLLRLDRDMASRFKTLGERGVDAATTRAAAIKQLDACNDSLCLAKAYGDWIRYIDQNYATGEPVTE